MIEQFTLDLKHLRQQWTIKDPNGASQVKRGVTLGYRPIHIMPINVYIGSGLEALRLAQYMCELHNKGL